MKKLMMIGKEYNSVLDLLRAFPDEKSCVQYLEEMRWSDKVISPFDDSSVVYKCKYSRYRCKNTRKYFNVKTRTIFEGSKISLRCWFLAIWILNSGKKGISSYHLAKTIGVTQKTAWFMAHRIRACYGISEDEPMLIGEIEMDETFVGGKNKNRHRNKKVPKCQGRSFKDKTPVFGMVERGGRLITQVLRDTSQSSITPIVLKWVDRTAIIYTDEWVAYDKVGQVYQREFVDHGRGQYAKDGGITTNRIEGFWSIFKRGIIGVYQMASRKHLQRYCDEFTWRYNTRTQSEEDRFNHFFGNIEHRLTYNELTRVN